MRADPIESGQGRVEEAEAVVIGSGFGGAVAASRLTQAGLKVLILERGRRYEAKDFPALPPDPALLPDLRRWSWKHHEGLWDIVDLEELISVQAAGYGGGSLIYANVHLRPPDAVFDKRWPDIYCNGAVLQDFFDLAAYMLEAAPVTAHPDFASRLVKSDQLSRVAAHLKRTDSFFHPPLTISYEERENVHGVRQNACTQCGQCVSGCPEKAKNTLDFNYLALAERRGARVITQCEVMDIEELGDNCWRITCMDHLRAEERCFVAKHVFLCAGSIHSTRLLARAKLKPRARQAQRLVGTGYFPGGDALGVVYDTQHPQHPRIGPTITTTLVHNNPESGSFFMVQDGGYSPHVDRLIGILRAPMWVGRNRLSRRGTAKIDASDIVPLPAPVVPATPGFVLVSPVDDLLDAIASGDFTKAVPRQVYDAFPAFLSELRNSLLLTEIVDRTIEGTILKRLKDFWLTRNWDPQKFPLRLLVRFGKWMVRRFAKTELLADQVLRALLTGAGLSREKLAAKTLGYAAEAPERRTMLLAMGTDAAPSVLLYDREQDRLVADLELFRLSPGYTRQERLMTDIADALGGELRVNPAWAFLGKPITVHNQGGCRMSDTPELGVTTSDGKVWGCEGLYVLDGSVLCTSVGVNPSATIAAIAERNVLQFIRAHTRNAEWPERDATDGAREYREQRILAAARTHHALNEKWALTPPDKPGKPFKSPALGLRFRESMQGFYQPTSSAPTTEPGYRRCETEGRPGYPVELTLDVTTEDLATFFEDPAHELRIAGDIAIRLPQDERARTRRVTGRLELMVPPHKPYGISLKEPDRLRAQRFAGQDYSTRVGPPPDNDERLMRYWVAFEDEAGQNWLLRGYKRVRDDPGIDAWRDTASLFVQLLGPSNRPYPQKIAQDDSTCGAGVVHADVTGFLFKQLRSIEVLGTEDPARIVWATAKFATFFFGALQRIYLPEIQAALDALFARKATTVMIEPPALPDCPPPPEPEPPSTPDPLPPPAGVADQDSLQ